MYFIVHPTPRVLSMAKFHVLKIGPTELIEDRFAYSSSPVLENCNIDAVHALAGIEHRRNPFCFE